MVAAVLLRVWLFMAIVGALGPGRANAASDPENPYRPCIQRKVPEISAGMVWVGPAVLEDDRRWRESRGIANLVARISTRRMPVEEAYAEIDRFAATLDADRNGPLTLLFTGLLQTINALRSEIIAGIERYARRQVALADQIRMTTVKLNALRAKDSPSEAERAKARELDEQLLWDTRVFDEREQSLSYVCESPVLLEQRLFALARQIMYRLE